MKLTRKIAWNDLPRLYKIYAAIGFAGSLVYVMPDALSNPLMLLGGAAGFVVGAVPWWIILVGIQKLLDSDTIKKEHGYFYLYLWSYMTIGILWGFGHLFAM